MVHGGQLNIADTAFKQQRLKAWQPILTPKAVLPTLFLIGLIFAPIGALIVWGSGQVTAITLDYTQCDADAPTSGDAEAMPSGQYDCKCPFTRPRAPCNLTTRRPVYWLLVFWPQRSQVVFQQRFFPPRRSASPVFHRISGAI